jgi:formylglycine-generating enzyme required for sulfatase activity
MVFLPEGYCIDSTEVTRGQYQAWLDSNPFTDGQRSECAFNTDFAPDAHCMGQADPSADCPSHPVVCVDWCDANAYCQAVGKRLCGKIGGGAYPFYDLKNMGQSQWYQACISGGANNIYPYGNTYRASACNGRDYQESLHPGRFTTVPVASMPQCQSAILGYQGVFDLSGNVEELQDSCDAGGEYTGLDCETRGGYFFHADMFLDCSQSFSQPIQIGSSEIGFRCCFP